MNLKLMSQVMRIGASQSTTVADFARVNDMNARSRKKWFQGRYIQH